MQPIDSLPPPIVGLGRSRTFLNGWADVNGRGMLKALRWVQPNCSASLVIRSGGKGENMTQSDITNALKLQRGWTGGISAKQPAGLGPSTLTRLVLTGKRMGANVFKLARALHPNITALDVTGARNNTPIATHHTQL